MLSEVAEQYFQARNSMDFEVIKGLVNDSITVIEGDYVMPYSHKDFYEVFQWDSVFQTKYKIVGVEEIDEHVIATVDLTSIRNKFLQNDRMTCQFKLSFQSGKISEIQSLDCRNANWEIWQERVQLLVNWVDDNHPELNGFIHDMTMDGAENYIRAIQLFEASENDMQQLITTQ